MRGHPCREPATLCVLPRATSRHGPKLTFGSQQVFLTLVDEMLDDWPEIHERDRKWITRDQAQAETHWREEIAASFHLIPSDQELRRMFG